MRSLSSLAVTLSPLGEAMYSLNLPSRVTSSLLESTICVWPDSRPRLSVIGWVAIEKSSVLIPLPPITSGSWPGLIWNTVVPRAADERVVAAVGDERVVAGAADQAVGPRAGHQQVVARAAEQRLVRPRS